MALYFSPEKRVAEQPSLEDLQLLKNKIPINNTPIIFMLRRIKGLKYYLTIKEHNVNHGVKLWAMSYEPWVELQAIRYKQKAISNGQKVEMKHE